MGRQLIFFIIILLVLATANLALARSHPYFILDIAVSNDGRYVGICRIDDKLVLLYDLDQKKILNVFTNDRGMQSTVAFTPDSKYFVFQNADHELFFYDIKKGEITKEYLLERGAYSMAFFSDNNRFIWGSGNGKIEYVDMEKNEKIQLKPSIQEHASIGFEAPILQIKISPDEKYFLTTTYTDGYNLPEPDEDIKLIEKGTPIPYSHDPKTGGPRYTLDEYEFRHLGLNLWDARTLKKIKKLGAKFVNGRTWPSFSPDMKYIIAYSENGTGIFDLKTGELYSENHYLTNGGGYVSDSCYVTLFATDSHLTFWNLTKSLNKEDESHRIKTISVKYSPCTGAIATLPDKNLIVIGTRDGSISLYKYLPEKHDIKLEWHPKSISAGLIRWLSPFETMNLNTVQIEDLQRRYEEAQRKLIEQEKKQGTVETKYHELPVPSK